MSTDFSFAVNYSEDGRFMILKLIGVSEFSTSISHMASLATALSKSACMGLIVDYRQFVLNFELEDYEKIADAYCQTFPEGLPVSFLYNEDQAARVIYMTRRLEESGRPSHAFGTEEDALVWLDQTVSDKGVGVSKAG